MTEKTFRPLRDLVESGVSSALTIPVTATQIAAQAIDLPNIGNSLLFDPLMAFLIRNSLEMKPSLEYPDLGSEMTILEN
jgi:hypothetical protein